MDSKSLKYMVLLFFVNLDYGHPRDSLVVGKCVLYIQIDQGFSNTLDRDPKIHLCLL